MAEKNLLLPPPPLLEPSSSDHASSSKELEDAFLEYEAQLSRTAEKRLKGRQSTIRYNKKRFLHALKRLQTAKVVVTRKENDDDDHEVRKSGATTTTTTTNMDAKCDDEVRASRQDCLRRLGVVAEDAVKMRTVLSEAKKADEMLEKIRNDPLRRKIDVGVDDIIKELDDLENRCRRGIGKTTQTMKASTITKPTKTKS